MTESCLIPLPTPLPLPIPYPHNNVDEELSSLESCLYSLGSELKCAVCLCLVVSPVSLRCSHFFCSNCLDQVLSQHRGECPFCRERFTRRNYLSDQVIRQVTAQFQKLCQIENITFGKKIRQKNCTMCV